MEGEDIISNTLSKLISKEDPQIWQKCTYNEWKICLPQSCSIRRELRKEDICKNINLFI